MKAILSQQDLERPRTPTGLRQHVTDLFDRIGNDEQYKAQARLHKGLSKYLIREIYPLGIYATWRYPKDDVLCCPKIGNQGHDAVVTDLSGNPLVDIEITWPIDGQYENQQARLLNERGFTDIHVGDSDEDRAKIMDRIVRAAEKKAQKDYGNATLLVVFDLWPAFFMDRAADQRDASALVKSLQDIEFRAGSVFLVLLPVEYVEKLSLNAIVPVKSDEQLVSGDEVVGGHPAPEP